MLTPQQEIHLKTILSLVDGKYRSGAETHKDTDPLMSMPIIGGVENSLSEAIDLVVYLSDLRDKLIKLRLRLQASGLDTLRGMPEL